MAFTVFPDKLISMGNCRVFIRPDPGRRSATITLLSDVYDVESERRIADGDIPEHVPAVRLACEGIVIKSVNCDPAMEKAGVVGPSEGGPF
jgi:hypothetical protein